MDKPTRLDYCQYCLAAPLTHFADHSEDFSHDMINRYLAGERIAPRLVWEHVQAHIDLTQEGYVIFDDTVLDKRHARKIALVRRQYSGNATGQMYLTCSDLKCEGDTIETIYQKPECRTWSSASRQKNLVISILLAIVIAARLKPQSRRFCCSLLYGALLTPQCTRMLGPGLNVWLIPVC